MKADAPFVRLAEEASFGFTRSVIWIRFEAVNAATRAQPWLLELPYPHLDSIDVYALADDGALRHRHAGDRIPFSAREVDVPSFVFPEEAPPGQHTTYYLRVRTDGSLRVPLRAWLALDFVSHESQQNLILWLFYGIVAAMTCYNFGTAALLKQREYVFYLGHLVAMGGGIFTLSGQTFQYVLPNFPALANRALSICLAFGLLFLQLYAREVLGHFTHIPQLASVRRSLAWTLMPCPLVIAAALFAPHTYSQITAFGAIFLYMPVAACQLLLAWLYGGSQLRLYVLSLTVVAVTIPVALLAHAKLIPPYTLAVWAGHIGCASYSILTSLALPMRVSDLGHRLAGLNEQLSDNVAVLKEALVCAEQATRVKDEFIATMSHELRTPLNAIINVPQGLLEDFETAAAAVCTACTTEFLLEPGDLLSSETSCSHCGSQGTLRAQSATVYTGRPAHTARFLQKIERAGQHLLQMVNGVLDFSKMEAGRLELAREQVDLGLLVTEVVDQMSDLAQRRGVKTELATVAGHAQSEVDPVRIRQVLMNLLTNAIKFSETGSTIHVKWEQDADADRIEVRDHGIGIAPENHQRIFTSFEQVHKGDTRKYGGTGLGLSISRSLVRMHGGELWVESELQEGATFRFTLPRNLAHSGEISHPKAAVA
jgi:signal transduction histidine kinase